MAFDRTCDDCGATYTAFGHRSKYCPVCAKKRERQARKEYRKRMQAKKQAGRTVDDERFFADTPENILACLACTKHTCVLDSKDTCPLLSKKEKPNAEQRT